VGRVRDEIKQTKPFASPAEEAVVTLLSTADTLRTALSSALEPQGITLQQHDVPRILRGGRRGRSGRHRQCQRRSLQCGGTETYDASSAATEGQPRSRSVRSTSSRRIRIAFETPRPPPAASPYA
jgi:hypothetical protein